MRKSIIFISAVLTTFALVILYNVASAYHNNQSAAQVAATVVQPTATLSPDPTDVATPTQTFLSAVQAAQLATRVVGNTNLLSAESSNLNGLNAYKITFTNNDVVYVGLDGQILSVQIAPVVVNATFPQLQPNKTHNGSHSTSNGSSNDHTSAESQQEHED